MGSLDTPFTPNHADDNGIISGTFGCLIQGSIDTTPASDSKNKANQLSVSQNYAGDPRVEDESCTFSADQMISGGGNSSIVHHENAYPGYLTSYYHAETTGITTAPAGRAPAPQLQSSTRDLINDDWYSENQMPVSWSTTITVLPNVNVVNGAAHTTSWATVYGEECTAYSNLGVFIVLELTTPQ